VYQASLSLMQMAFGRALTLLYVALLLLLFWATTWLLNSFQQPAKHVSPLWHQVKSICWPVTQLGRCLATLT
jgi:hypothetical protein